MIWYEFSAYPISDITHCTTEADRQALLTRAFNASIGISNPFRASALENKYKKQEYWHTLMLYDIFYDIMKNKYRTPLKKNSASE